MSRSSYREMLKATSALSGAKIVTIGISIVRTKMLAIFLGASGMGIVNLISSSIDLARVLFSSGINGATVRKVAEAANNNDEEQLERTYRISVKSALLLGITAAVVFTCISEKLAIYLLGDPSKYWWFAVASLSLVVTPLLAVELALLQGIRQSKSLSLCQIYTSILGTLITVVLVVAFGLSGGIFSLVCVAFFSAYIHRFYVKKHLTFRSKEPIRNFLSEFLSLSKMGSAFALNGIWITAGSWLNILFITKYYGPEIAPSQVGLHGAASMMANVYIGILISAMGTEFYPRLVASSKDKNKLNQLLNQQTRLSIAIGIPVSLALLICAPWILRVMYTAEFSEATDTMRWLILGMIIRFITCPIGFCVYAACKPRTIAINEIVTGGTMVAICYWMISIYGLKGAGIGATLANLIYLIGITLFMYKHKINWEWHTLIRVLSVIIASSAILIILLCFDQWWAIVTSFMLLALISFLLIKNLKDESGINLSIILNKFKK